MPSIRLWHLVEMTGSPAKAVELLAGLPGNPAVEQLRSHLQDFDTAVSQQRRDVLDVEVPDEIGLYVARELGTKVYFTKDEQRFRVARLLPNDEELPLFRALEVLGGEGVADLLEFGSYPGAYAMESTGQLAVGALWRGRIDQILYGLMFAPELHDGVVGDVARAMGERRYFVDGADAYAEAIDIGLAQEGALSSSFETSHDEKAFRDFLGQLRKHLGSVIG